MTRITRIARTIDIASKRLHVAILDILFPIQCLGCKTAHTWLCDTCLLSIPVHSSHLCPQCKQSNTPYGQVCFSCIKTSSLDGILVASSYKQPLLAKAIHHFKYRFIPNLHIPLSKLLLHSIQHTEIPLPDMICPVPLHPLRLRWRGFNQSELLAQELSSALTPHLFIPIIHQLIRHRFTAPQMSIRDARERNLNLQDAFAWERPHEKNAVSTSLANTYIWLVDDVATTGATLNECARILKQNGAKKVFGIVLAR